MAAANASVEGVNLAPTAKLTATSSKGTGGWYIRNLVDGNKDAQSGDSIGWQSAEDYYPVLTLDLGEPMAFTSMELYPSGMATDADYGAFMPEDMVISVSSDGKTWSEAADVTGYAYDGSPLKIDLQGAVGRYVRLQVKKARADLSGTPLTQLGELELYGTPAADKSALTEIVNRFRTLGGDTASTLFLTAAEAINGDTSRQGYVDLLTRKLGYEVARLQAEAETETETAPVTEAPTDAPDTAVPTDEAMDAPATDPETDAQKTGGCASSVAVGFTVLLSAVAALMARKKKD